MGWLSSWFSSATNQRSRNGLAISSTHEAFSLSTSSPPVTTSTTAHPDAFSFDAINTPDIESATTPSYTYPPPRGESYGYVPTSTGRQSSLLPLHHQRDSPTYPPPARTWNRIRTWLAREYPELGDTLNYGILPQDLAQIEMQFGFALPPAVRDSYLAVDGQEPESSAGCSEGLFFGLTMLPLEDVLEEWRFWREVDEDPLTGANPRLRDAMQSLPQGWIRKVYSQRGWIPLIADKAGNYVGVDLNPDEGGSVGQVIIFGRDFDTKVVLWKGDGPAGWATWLASFVEELESGEGYEIGAGNDTSDGSEDGVGYDSYFQDGNGRGQGEGGGESGHGGLRLIGDYRGWSTLDAWADRSLRKWYEVGLIQDSSLDPVETPNSSENVGLGVIEPDAPNVNLDDSAPPPPPPEKETISLSRRRTPSISITKPPAPLPVELPTPYDIRPSYKPSSFDDDLESGTYMGMRETSLDQEKRLVPPRESKAASGASGSPPSLSIPPSKSFRAGSSSPVHPSSPAHAPVQDFFSDPDPALETAPIEPTSPMTPKSPVDSVVKQELIAEEVSKLADDNDEDGALLEPESSLTVRLVGGGGTAGTLDAAPDDDDARVVDSEPEREADADAEEASVIPATAPASVDPTVKKDVKKHERKRSGLTGLKKFGNLGGLRKKESSSDVKELN